MNDFQIIVVDGAFPSSVALSRDLLATASAIAKKAGVATPSWEIYSLDGKQTALQGGFSIETKRLPKARQGNRGIWVIPGLGINDPTTLNARLQRDDAVGLIRRIRTHVAGGGHVAACGSAVFLLRDAGVLSGLHVTTSWWLAPLLAQSTPDCIVKADRLVVSDGSVVTAGGSIAHADLMLYLLRHRFGHELCDSVSRMLLLDGRQTQTGFVIPEILASGDALVARLASRVAAALPNPPSIAQLAQEFCVSERTLARHVRAVTGRNTTGLVQSVKLHRARTLLERSRMSIEQIATAVGYQDATALRRLMRKTVGVSPSHFRSASGVAEPA